MNNWINIFTIIGTGLTVIASVYGFFRWFMNIFNKRFEKMESKFEMLDNRIFQLAMGKSLKEIMQEEKIDK